MKLEVTKEAQEVLKNKLEADDQLLLDSKTVTVHLQKAKSVANWTRHFD